MHGGHADAKMRVVSKFEDILAADEQQQHEVRTRRQWLASNFLESVPTFRRMTSDELASLQAFQHETADLPIPRILGVWLASPDGAGDLIVSRLNLIPGWANQFEAEQPRPSDPGPKPDAGWFSGRKQLRDWRRQRQVYEKSMQQWELDNTRELVAARAETSLTNQWNQTGRVVEMLQLETFGGYANSEDQAFDNPRYLLVEPSGWIVAHRGHYIGRGPLHGFYGPEDLFGGFDGHGTFAQLLVAELKRLQFFRSKGYL